MHRHRIVERWLHWNTFRDRLVESGDQDPERRDQRMISVATREAELGRDFELLFLTTGGGSPKPIGV